MCFADLELLYRTLSCINTRLGNFPDLKPMEDVCNIMKGIFESLNNNAVFFAVYKAIGDCIVL